MSDRSAARNAGRDAGRRAPLPILFLLACLAACLLSGCGAKTITGLVWREPEAAGPVGSGSAVARSALSQVGKPYRYGGSTPRGFDCSGLIWWAYRQNGVTVPRVTTDQAKAGKAVKASAMQPGDVLVFKSRSSSRGLHTALYAGNGTFVHSPSSGSRVRTDKIANSYWSKRLIRVRRILK